MTHDNSRNDSVAAKKDKSVDGSAKAADNPSNNDGHKSNDVGFMDEGKEQVVVDVFADETAETGAEGSSEGVVSSVVEAGDATASDNTHTEETVIDLAQTDGIASGSDLDVTPTLNEGVDTDVLDASNTDSQPVSNTRNNESGEPLDDVINAEAGGDSISDNTVDVDILTAVSYTHLTLPTTPYV